MYRKDEPIVMLTAYDCLTARWLDENDIDIALVGDSLATVFKGEPDTLSVTVEEMLYHTRVVARNSARSMVVSDMPFLSYQTGASDAIRNCGLMLKQGGATAVKMEGGAETAETIGAVVRAGIPVMGHIGMRPQLVMQYGGYPVVGKDRMAIEKLSEDAKAIQEAGVFSIVIESVPEPVATALTKKLKVPTIGIGAGIGCSGQVLVTPDLLGMFRDFKPKFVKQYAQLGAQAIEAVGKYRDEVKNRQYPAEEHTYPLADENLLRQLDELFA